MNDKLIYHLTTEKELNEHTKDGLYSPSSLAKEGFIHFSTKDMVTRSAMLYYPHVDQVLVIEVCSSGLGKNLKFEKIKTGEHFPHLYAPLKVSDIVQTFSIFKNDDFRFE